jgi:hypothetical protein
VQDYADGEALGRIASAFCHNIGSSHFATCMKCKVHRRTAASALADDAKAVNLRPVL